MHAIYLIRIRIYDIMKVIPHTCQDLIGLCYKFLGWIFLSENVLNFEYK